MYEELKQAWAQLTAPGAPFEVTLTEVRGVKVRTYLQAPANLRDLWLASAGFHDRDYLVYRDERWTYGEVHSQVAAIANYLVAKGVGPGDRVAIAMRNYPEYMPCYWATVATGASVVGMNAWWVSHEMAYGLDNSRPRVLIADQERLERFFNMEKQPDCTLVGVRLPEPIPGVTPFEEVLQTAGELPMQDIDPDDDACIFYTSGTTGYPKGAQLTHRGCVNNVMSIAFWAQCSALATGLRDGLDPETVLRPDPDALQPCSLVTTPLFHVTANNCVAHGNTLSGGKLVHMYRWDPLEALQLIEREKVTSTTGVPVMARELVSHPDFSRYDTSSLIQVGGGGAQLQPDLVGKIDQKVATARPGTGYGMTETCGVITSISGEFFLDKPESCGPALPVYEAECFDLEGRQLPRGETGELRVRGGQVIKGYLNRPEATAESITDGWLHTGDVARMDAEGFVYIVDRIKEMVLRGGENIYCAEVESAIFQHPAVAECAVFGVDDERLGEEVGAALHLKAGQKLDAGALRDHLSHLLANHKIPRYLWFLTRQLPRNANGKFLKRELREKLAPADAV